MLDAVSLDQLRTFIACSRGGKFFSRRAQTPTSQSCPARTVANLEGQLSVPLFDRANNTRGLRKRAKPCSRGQSGCGGMDGFKARARTMGKAWSLSSRWSSMWSIPCRPD